MTRLLLADDNAINRKLLAWQLETLGFSCDDAVCGRAALDACRAQRFDLIFMDVNLGDMDGYTVTRRLREREREDGSARTPIVAVTAHTGVDEYRRCMDSGMDDFLGKPITIGPLARLLVRWGVHGYDAGVVPGDASPNAPDDAPDDAPDEERPLLLPTAVDWLRALEVGSAHDGLGREIADDFSTRATDHLRRLRAAFADGDPEVREYTRFALRRHSIGVGAVSLAVAVSAAAADGDGDVAVDAGLARIERIMTSTCAELRRRFP